jgi:lysophospholipase
VRIANDIKDNYDDYDAFIVLHGTDTMAYTASALSFMLENLKKTVIVTGSQIPLSVPLNDGEANLLGALTVAGTYRVPEVLLYFNSKAMRGNRCTKLSASDLDAFGSQNFDPLISLGVDYKVEWNQLLRTTSRPFSIQSKLSENIAVFRLFPGFSVKMLKNLLQPPIEGLVLQTFGAGNAPDGNQDLIDALREASERGVVIVNCTQCPKGTVEAHYATGVVLKRAGVVPGQDMTVEAALTKLAYLLGKELPKEEVRAKMLQSMRGELTTSADGSRFSFQDNSFIESVFQAVSATQVGNCRSAFRCSRSVAFVVLFSSCCCRTAPATCILTLCLTLLLCISLFPGGARQRPAAAHRRRNHACADVLGGGTGNAQAAEGDGQSGCGREHARLRQAVSGISVGPAAPGAARANSSSTPSLRLFPPCSTRHPLHLAAAEGDMAIAAFLVENDADVNAIDRFGNTPLCDAIKNGHTALCDFLRSKGAELMLTEAKQADLLLNATNDAKLDLVKLLLDGGVDPTVADYDKRTALHIAVARKDLASDESPDVQLKMVELLLKRGASPDAVDRFGTTPATQRRASNAGDAAVLALLTAGVGGQEVPIVDVGAEGGAAEEAGAAVGSLTPTKAKLIESQSEPQLASEG